MSAKELKEASIDVVRRLRGEGYLAYFAGGCVRDMLMGNEPDDYDVATDAEPEAVSALFPRTVKVGAQFGVVVVMSGECQTEVATFRSDAGYSDGRHPDAVRFSSPEEDAQRRDFTINGLFFDPLKDEVIDYIGGREDLKGHIIRAIGEPRVRFEEDQLRLMRAVRFSARLGFEIEPATRKAIAEMAERIHSVSAERIRDELRRMLCHKSRVRALELLDETGLLGQILPEVTAMKNVAQPPEYHPEGDVFEHSKLCLARLPDDAPFELAMATLLHDAGKPQTFEEREGRMRYYRHEAVGEKIAGRICRRLKMSRAETGKITWLVRRHMIFKDSRKMRKSTLKKLFAAEHYHDLAELGRADALASTGDLSDYDYCRLRLEELSEEELRPEPLITGHDLIDMGLEPGPVFSVILGRAYDEQLEGSITDRKDALEYAGHLAAEMGALPPEGAK